MSKILKSSSVVKIDEPIAICYDGAGLDCPTTEEQLQGAPSSSDYSDKLYDSIINRAKDEAKGISDTIIQSTLKDCAAMREKAEQEAAAAHQNALQEGYREGYDAGYAEGYDEIKDQAQTAIHDTLQALGTLKEAYERLNREYERSLSNLAVDIAAKILGSKLEQDPLVMAPLVKNALAAAKGKKWITVGISDKMPQLIEQLQADSLLASQEHLTIQAQELPLGGCMVETDENVIDASIWTQLETLRELMERITRE